MSEDSMFGEMAAEWIRASELAGAKHDVWLAEQRVLRSEIPDWLHSQLTEIAEQHGTFVSYWKRYGRFRAYVDGLGWVDVRAEIEKARGEVHADV